MNPFVFRKSCLKSKIIRGIRKIRNIAAEIKENFNIEIIFWFFNSTKYDLRFCEDFLIIFLSIASNRNRRCIIPRNGVISNAI